MESQEYARKHFEEMAALVEELRALPAQVLEHEYSYQSFGSWSLLVRFKGFPVRLTFEGRDGEYVLRRSYTKKRPYSWSDLLWRRPVGDGDHPSRPELAEANRSAVDNE